MATKININKLDYSNIIVKVKLTGVRLYTLRIRLGLLLVRLGVWITGLGFEYEGIEE